MPLSDREKVLLVIVILFVLYVLCIEHKKKQVVEKENFDLIESAKKLLYITPKTKEEFDLIESAKKLLYMTPKTKEQFDLIESAKNLLSTKINL